MESNPTSEFTFDGRNLLLRKIMGFALPPPGAQQGTRDDYRDTRAAVGIHSLIHY